MSELESSTAAGQTTTYAYDAELARIKKATVNGVHDVLRACDGMAA